MVVYSEDECAHLKRSIYESLEILGRDAEAALLYHLKRKLGVISSSATLLLDGEEKEEEIPCPPLEDIESALRGLLGPGAEIIIMRIRAALKRHGVAA